MLRILVVFIISAWTFRSLAQQPEVTQYDVDQGLPQSLVRHVMQDADGFIWLGTGDGLARFDGSRFVVYKHDPHDSTTISNNSIWGISETEPGHLWIGTRNSLDRLDRRTGEFEHLRIGTRDGRNGCWQPLATSTNAPLFYSPLTCELLRVTSMGHQRSATGHRDSYCMRMSADGSRIISISDPDSMIIADNERNEDRWRRIPVDSGDRVVDMIALGTRWLILTQRTGWIMEENGTRRELPDPLRSMVNAAGVGKYLQRDAHDALWMGLSGLGVVVLRPDLSIGRSYRLEAKGTTAVNITAIRFDRQGNTWVGTDGHGVFKISPQRIKFGRVMPGLGLSWEPASWFVRGFAQWDDHRVMVSFHQGGLALFDERTGELSPFSVPGREPSTTFSRVCNDVDGLVWLKDEHGIIVLNPGSGAIVFAPSHSASTGLLRDSVNVMRLVEGRRSSPYRFSSGSMTAGPPTRHPVLDSLLPNVERIAIDASGQWWVSGPEMALSVWNSDGPLTISGERPAAGTRMMNLVAAGGGRAWMTTNDGLLLLHLSPPGILKHYTIYDGLPDQFVYGVVADDDGGWWISSNNGVARFDMAKQHFRTYTSAHGLQSREFNAGAFFRSRSGRIYFGGVNGFNHFQPGAVQDDTDPAHVRIINLSDREGPLSFEDGVTVQLPFPRNELRVELAVLEFTAPMDDRVKWRLLGYDDSWRTIPATTPIELINLPNGAYILEAVGINGDGVESDARQLLRVVVERPLWASTWFIICVVGSIIGSMAWLVVRAARRRMQRKLAETERELRELRLRTRLAKDIHDDVGSGLARMAALSRSAKRETDAAERFDKVAGISGELLDNLRDVVWMNDPRHDTLNAVLLRIRDHAGDLFEESGATVRCEFPEPLSTRRVDGAFPRDLYLIAKEALHNAHKYSKATVIVLRWWEHNGSCTMEVSDNGVGAGDGATQGSGYGTENMRQRAAEIGATYERVACIGGGTTVRVHCRP
jgi:signal transduction histidine kinase/ligand-binding sensor domain-containing protein